MILPQDCFFVGPHNLTSLRGSAKKQSCGKRAFFDPEWSFAIPSNIYEIFRSHLDAAISYASNANKLPHKVEQKIFSELRASFQQYAISRMNISTRIYSTQVRETFGKCNDIKQIWLQTRSQDSRETLSACLLVMQNCLDKCEIEWRAAIDRNPEILQASHSTLASSSFETPF